jgi:hypothetical protein
MFHCVCEIWVGTAVTEDYCLLGCDAVWSEVYQKNTFSVS